MDDRAGRSDLQQQRPQREHQDDGRLPPSARH